MECISSAREFGCGGSGDSPSSSPNAPGTSDSSVPQTNTPASFAGKSYSFTVTARQGLSEPVGATYTITASNAQGTGLGNYLISYADGSLTVTAKALTVTPGETCS